jgi:hypothetical protein
VCDADKVVSALLAAHAGTAPDAAPLALSEAIEAYEKELVARGGEEVRTSTKSALFIHNVKTMQDAPVLKQGYGKGEAAAEK